MQHHGSIILDLNTYTTTLSDFADEVRAILAAARERAAADDGVLDFALSLDAIAVGSALRETRGVLTADMATESVTIAGVTTHGEEAWAAAAANLQPLFAAADLLDPA